MTGDPAAGAAPEPEEDAAPPGESQPSPVLDLGAAAFLLVLLVLGMLLMLTMVRR